MYNTGWGLGNDTEYCYTVRVVETNGIEGEVYDEDTNEGLENSRTLNTHQGGNEAEFHHSKRET